MAAALGVGRFAYTPLLPQMVSAEGWTYGQAGDLASANFVGYFIGALLAPFLIASRQVRKWVALSMIASVVTTFLGAGVTGYEQWLVLRLAAGIASAFCLVVITSQLMQTLQNNEAGHLGNIHFAGVGLGILLCMAAVQMAGDVSQQWARQGLLAAFLMASAWFLISRGPWQLTQEVGPAVKMAISSAVARLVIGYGLFGFGYVVAATFVVAMGERLSLQGIDPGVSWIVVGASTLPSVYLWQWFAHKKGLRLALVVSYLVLAVGVFLAGWATSIWLLLLGAAFLGGTFGGITALGLSAGRALSGSVAKIVSLMTVAFSLGQLFGPALAGRMADLSGGFFWPSVLASVLVLLAAGLVPRDQKLS